MHLPDRRRRLILTTIAVTTSVLVVAAYVLKAASLAAYPWDWSPDEGLYLDYALRLVYAPASLHPKSFVPFPSAYGPGLPALLAPAVASDRPLLIGRLLMLGCALVGGWATYALAGRRASRPLALAAVALALAPFDLTFWYVLIRPDGPMLTLLLLAALALLPRQLVRGADVLSRARIASGVALLLAATLTKQTAVLHGAPLVLGWWWVDRRSAVRLAASLAASGLVVVALLQWATSGGFLWVNRVWGLHARQPGLAPTVAAVFVGRAWPLLVVAAVAFVVARRPRAPRDARSDGALLLVLGGLAAAPLTGKFGAWWNYFLPLLPATAIASARMWSAATSAVSARRNAELAAAAALAVLALALAAARTFPLPTSADEKTARVFYDYVRENTRETGGPILAIRPELAYVVVGQTVEVEGSCYREIANGHAPGTQLIPERLAAGAYSLVLLAWPMPADAYAAMSGSYVSAGSCALGYYYGRTPVAVIPRKDAFRALPILAGARCAPAGR